MALKTEACAVCGSCRFAPVYPGTIAESNAAPGSYYSSSRVRAGYLPIVRCRECGLLMTNPRDDEATVHNVYRALEDRSYDAEASNREHSARDYVRLVRRYNQAPRRVLDAGCATGFFVAAAASAGWEAAGIDTSEWAIAEARRRCPRAVFQQGPIEGMGFPEGSFDVITLWDVLEHVSAPAGVLTRLRGWLEPGGHLFVNVPNGASLIARLMGPRWMLLLREHLWYFSPATLARLLGACGYEVLRMHPHRVRFSLFNILLRMSQYDGPSAAVAHRLMRAGWTRNVAVRFPVGEMTVVARAV